MFKRFLVCLIAVLVLFSQWINNSKPLFYNLSDTYELHLDGGGSLAQMVKATDKDFLLHKNVIGESCSFYEKDFSVEEFFSNYDARILFTEKTEEGVSFYGYSRKIKYSERLKGKIVNLHVHVKGDRIKVGSPIIYGSF